MRLIQNGRRKSPSMGVLTGVDIRKLAKFKKVAGVSVYLVDTPKQKAETKFQGLSGLESELSHWAFKKQDDLFQNNPSIAIDGWQDMDNPTGVLNWYCDERQQDRVGQLLQEWVVGKQQQGFQISVRGPERSNSQDRLVYRIEIVQNPTQEIPRPPEMNITYGNWGAALQALNLDVDPQSGSLSIQALQRALRNFKPHLANEFTKDPEESGGAGTGQARIQDMGRSLEQIMRYVQILQQMVEFGLRNGYQEIAWA